MHSGQQCAHPPFQLFNRSCYGLEGVSPNSIHALVTDPPYGISYQGHHWDKSLPDPSIWNDCFRVLRPGAFGLVFSCVRQMHRLTTDLEASGFLIRDVLFWAFLNGMPKSRDIALEVDKALGVESTIADEYKYVPGYKKSGAPTYTAKIKKHRRTPASPLARQFRGAGLALKPAYEPIILIQKPLEKGLSIAENMIRYHTGALNLEECRIPYHDEKRKVRHHPHPLGRMPANIIRTDAFGDGYDKFFLVPKVRQNADPFNRHPTIKPVALMQHLVKLVSFEGQTILDPFTGSGSTGVAALQLNRRFIGYELEAEYVAIALKRLDSVRQPNPIYERAQPEDRNLCLPF